MPDTAEISPVAVIISGSSEQDIDVKVDVVPTKGVRGAGASLALQLTHKA